MFEKKQITANEIKTTGNYFRQKFYSPFLSENMNVQEVLEYFEKKLENYYNEMQLTNEKIEKLTKVLAKQKEKEINHIKKNYYTIEEIKTKILNSFSCFSKAKEYMEKCIKENKAIKMNKKMLEALKKELEKQ